MEESFYEGSSRSGNRSFMRKRMEVRRSYRGRGKRDRGENFNFNLFIVPLGVSPVIISVVFCSIS